MTKTLYDYCIENGREHLLEEWMVTKNDALTPHYHTAAAARYGGFALKVMNGKPKFVPVQFMGQAAHIVQVKKSPLTGKALLRSIRIF